MESAITATDWLRALRIEASPRHHLVCFPPGGGSATAYRNLADRVGPGIAVLALQYPARQDRLGEPAVTDLHELADRIAEELLAQPEVANLSLFGHSMGATVAYETARRLESAGRTVARLFVSGRPAPSFVETRRLHLGSDEDLIADLERLAADPAPIAVLRTEPGLAEIVLPAQRGDYQAVETYARRSSEPLRCPVTALVSTGDPTMSVEQADEWADFTAAAFRRETFPGGHFYLDERPDEVAALVTRVLG
ncbi:thioesterase II family protein [Nocardia farcinica]|uniref:thioesterase II family protein n=1 Tax=Nocardia farcinica TaxID=37329 RepID=UPI0024571748|nr:alpha/beta fold hydrolase [Nocardia farcinica]